MKTITVSVGALSGAALQFNMLAARPNEALFGSEVVARAAGGALLGALVLGGAQAGLHRILQRHLEQGSESARFAKLDPWTALVFLWPCLGAFGVAVDSGHAIPLLLAFVLAKAAAFVFAKEASRRREFFLSREWLASLFLLSGFAALIYQIAWQRTLFSVYGVNIESVTVIVAIFMFGLGVGALSGGYLAKRFQDRLPGLFLSCELAIGAFGLASLPLIKAVGAATAGGSLVVTSIAVSTLLILPTALMGMTLPVLVSYLVQTRKHVGGTVGFLYFVNTLGSALASFVTVSFLLTFVGLQSVVGIAAAFNVLTGLLVFAFMRKAAEVPA